MRRVTAMSVFCLLALGLGGCPTTFSGNSYVVGGRPGCEKMCKKSKMRMSGMVFLGEYSSACICEVIPKPAEQTAPEPTAAVGAVGAAVASMSQTAHAEGAQPAPIYTNRE